jgi:hypothetical protein
MGTWGFICKGGCGKPIIEGEETIRIESGVYDGYGKTTGYDSTHGDTGSTYYHKVCLLESIGGDLDLGANKSDPNQGCGYPDPAFLRAGTKLYADEYAVLKGVEKVGILIDVSSAGAFDMLRSGFQLLSDAEHAMHYLGTKEVEVITFYSKVAKQETMHPEKLGSVIYDADGSWRKGGGGTDFRPPIEAAVKAGCGAIIVVSDLYGPLPDDPGVPVIWLCPVTPDLIAKNYDEGKRGQDLYDGAPAPGYGTVRYFEAYSV